MMVSLAFGTVAGRTGTACLALAAGTLLPTATAAQERRDPPRVEEIIVTGAKYGGYAADAAGEKASVPLREIPQTMTVVTRERIEDQNLHSLDDLMAQVPGIQTTNQGGQSSEDNRYISRGFQIDSYMTDGVPGITFTSPQPDLALYERVEVLRGPSGLFTGAGSPAGSINLVRKRPLDRFALSGSLAAGSWDNYRIEADVSAPVTSDGAFKVRGGGAWQQQDFFYDVAHRSRGVFYGVASLEIGSTTTLTFGGHYQRTKPAPNAGLPGLVGGGLLDVRRSTFIGADWAYRDNKERVGFAELTQDIGSNWTLRVNGQIAGEDRNEEYAFLTSTPVTPTNGRIGLSYINRDVHRNVASLDANLAGSFRLFGQTHSLLLGVDYQREKRLYDQAFAVNFAFQDVYDPDPDVPNPSLPLTSGTETRTTQHGIYGQLRLKLAEPLTIIGGGRVSWWENRQATRARATASAPWAMGAFNGYEVSAEVTPYAAILYELDKSWSLYASLAEIFSPQSALTFTGDTLPPVAGKQYEVGLKAEFAQGRLLASLAAYKIDQTGRAQPDPDHDGFSISSGRVVSKGIEAELTGRVLPDWSIAAGYAYNDNEYARNAINEGKPFTLISPKHSFKLWTNWRPASGALTGFELGGGLNAFSAQTAGTGASSVRQPGYAIVSARLGYRFDEHMSVAVNLNNLFDKTYYARIMGSGRGNYYGDPRSVMATLRVRY